MKRTAAVIILMGLLFSLCAEVSRPSLDGRAKVAEVGELPVGLFAKSASFLPGDTVIVTNPATKISIEVMIFGNIGSSEGIAILLSPEAARELYITKGSNVIVQVTKKKDTYSETSILSKTLQNYAPVEQAVVEELEEPVFDNPAEVEEAPYYFYEDPDSVIVEEDADLIPEELVYVEKMDDADVAPAEPADEDVAFDEPEWPAEVVEDADVAPAEPADEDVAFDEPEWPAEVVEDVAVEPAEPADEDVAFDEPEWPAEVVEDAAVEPAEPADEDVAFDEPEWPAEEPVEAVEPEEAEAVEPADELIEEPEAVEPAAEELTEEPVLIEEEAVIPEDDLEPADEEPAEPATEEPAVEEEPAAEPAELAEEPVIIEEEGDFIEEIEPVLIPAEPNPPLYQTIIQEEPEIVVIPVFEEEPEVMPVIIYEEIYDEPEVVAVVDDELPEEEPVIAPVEEITAAEPVVEPVAVPAVEAVTVPETKPATVIPYGTMESGAWYIQIASCSKLSTVEDIVATYGNRYPMVVVETSAGGWRILIGKLTADEYPVILNRFKSFGFTDAFVRHAN